MEQMEVYRNSLSGFEDLLSVLHLGSTFKNITLTLEEIRKQENAHMEQLCRIIFIQNAVHESQLKWID